MYKAFLRQRQWHHRTRCQLAAHPHQFAAEEQQKLDEKAVENQAEDEVECDVDEANKVQMVKKCHMRNSSIKQTLSRRAWPRNNRRCSKLHIRFRLREAESP